MGGGNAMVWSKHGALCFSFFFSSFFPFFFLFSFFFLLQADVLAQSKLREHQAQSEEFGLYNANKAGADVKPSEYIESVGRALDASPMKGRGGRTRCTCRRAVCICGARK